MKYIFRTMLLLLLFYHYICYQTYAEDIKLHTGNKNASTVYNVGVVKFLQFVLCIKII
jgi:hypothetical protein